jgi:hypothetical protein
VKNHAIYQHVAYKCIAGEFATVEEAQLAMGIEKCRQILLSDKEVGASVNPADVELVTRALFRNKLSVLGALEQCLQVVSV